MELPLLEAWRQLSLVSPDLNNGLTNHAPMVVEALDQMGADHAIQPWLEKYQSGFVPLAPATEPITEDSWPAFLGHGHRFVDWLAYFQRHFEQNPLDSKTLALWLEWLAPGFCGSATHGVLRLGHAWRGHKKYANAMTRNEVIQGLAYFAAQFQTLPENLASHQPQQEARPLRDGLVLQPADQRVFEGTIVSSLAALNSFPEFAAVIQYPDFSGDIDGALDQLVLFFTEILLENADDFLTAIVFVHGVTSLAILTEFFPDLPDSVQQKLLRYGWQSSAGLYAAFGRHQGPIPYIKTGPNFSETAAIAAAVAHGDDHVIKFTEAALKFYRRTGSELLPMAIDRVRTLLTASS